MAESDKSAHIRFRTVIEVLGKPKEHIEEAIKDYVRNIKEDRDLVVINEHFSETAEKDKFWLQFVELEVIAKGLPKLINFCFEYMPSSIEILKPNSFTMANSELSGFLNDLQSRLHNVDMVIKQLRSENKFIKRNMNTLLQNTIVMLLKLNSLSLEQLSKLTGIEKGELQLFIDRLVKENKIQKDGEIYSIVEHGRHQEQG